MRVAIAGAHGQVAMKLAPLLVERGDEVVGLVRNPDHAAGLRAVGAHPEVCDLEQATLREVSAAVRGSDAVVSAAGSGPGSSAARKLTMDRDGAIKLLEATSVEPSQYVMLSGQGVENAPDGDDVFTVYLRAKAQADAAVMASDRDWTVVRPGRLTSHAAIGRVRIDTVAFGGEISRADLAFVLAGIVGEPRARRHVLYVNSGARRVEEALAAALGGVGFRVS